MRIAITGATGFLGGNLAIRATEQGHEVVGICRRMNRTAHLADFPVDWRIADVTDRDSIAAAVAGCEVVFHCAAVISLERTVRPWVYEVNVTGTKNVSDACVEAGVRRLVHCSTVSVIGVETDGSDADESTSYNMPSQGLDDAYVRTKREAEEWVLAQPESALDRVVVNPGTMFGAFDPGPSSGKMILSVAQRQIPGAPPGVSSFVDVLDVVDGMLAAAERGVPGHRYILAGHNMPYTEFMSLVARLSDVPEPRPLPGVVVTLAGWAGEAVQTITGRTQDLNASTSRWVKNRHYRFSSAKAERELGYQISPLEPAVERALAWFRETGKL